MRVTGGWLRGGLAGTALLLFVPAGPVRGSSAERGVTAVATAEGSRFTVSAPGYLLVDTPADAGAPVAQSFTQTFGAVRSFAALPFPGDIVSSLPGLLQAFGAPALPVTYPLVVTAAHPSQPEAELVDPSESIRLWAQAGEAGSSSMADLSPGPLPGGPAVVTESTATVDGDGTMRAAATTTHDGVVIAQVIDLGVIRSSIEATLAPGAATPTVQRSLTVAGASVGGIPVTVDGAGVHAAGSPIPQSSLEPIDEVVQELLASAAIEVRTVEGGDLVGGGFANVVEVTRRGTLPLPGDPDGTITLIVGGSSVSIIAGEPGGVAEPALPPLASSEQGAPAAPAAAGGSGASAVAGTGAAPEPGRTAGTPSDTGEVAGAAVGYREPLVLEEPLALLYVVLAVGAFAGVTVSQLFARRREVP